MNTSLMISDVVGCGNTISSISSSRNSVSSIAVAPKIISEQAPDYVHTEQAVGFFFQDNFAKA